MFTILLNTKLVAPIDMPLRTAVARKKQGDSGKRWFAFFIGFVMLASVAAYVLSLNPNSQAGSFRYGGLIFKQDPQGFFAAEINSQPLNFFYRPDDLSDVDLPNSVVQKLAGTTALQITYYWNSSLAQNIALFQLDASNILDAKYGVFTQPGFTTPNPLNMSVITCASATSFMPVLLLQEANNTAIGADSSNPDCIVVNASSDVGFARVSERLLYAMLAGSGK